MKVMQILLWFSSTHARQQLSNPRIHLTFPSAGCVVTSRNARLATHDRNGNNHQDMSFNGEEVVRRWGGGAVEEVIHQNVIN